MKTSHKKYLRDAIGEILLVVIGMLMALQINNSNELRKNKEERAIILLAKKEDFIATRLNFLQTSKKQQNNCDVIEVKINLL
jgi:hypothetical protein